MVDINASENEWSLIKRRFEKEGLNFESTTPNQQSLQLFRWLADAEDNLKAARNINEKLRKQHEEEKKELDKYSDHLRQKCDNRVKEIESESQTLREDLEALLSGTQVISNIFRQEGLEDIANNSLGDQIAYLLVERSQMLEDLYMKKPHNEKSSPTAQESSESFSKIKTEREILKSKNEEFKNKTKVLSKKISFLEKSLKEHEEHDENLSYKLSEALMELEDKEILLKHYEKMGSDLGIIKSDVTGEPCNLNYAASKSRNYNGGFRRKSSVFFERRDSLELKNGGSDSPPTKVSSPFDSQGVNSKPHPTQLNDIKNLQNEVERLKINYVKAGCKYEELLQQYESLKLKSKNEVEMALQDQEWKVQELTSKMECLKNTLKILDENKKDEENLRNLMEKDLKELRNERLERVTRESENLIEMKTILEENLILKEKINFFEADNKILKENLRKYSIDSQDQDIE